MSNVCWCGTENVGEDKDPRETLQGDGVRVAEPR